AVQVGAFKNKENALRLADRLKVVFDYVEVALHDDKNKGTIYRLRVLKSKSLNKASEVVKKLEDMGFEGAFIVSL
ncbi:MAG: SPOR domain-containing protein, partial [Thermodesulfobacteriota bacterium]|nr:SPOR domain-containing protein [Thermodesulfobacteriota bacterium]